MQQRARAETPRHHVHRTLALSSRLAPIHVLPSRTRHAADELERWRRHAVLGTPVDNASDDDHPSRFCAIGDRNFSGAARAMADQRRAEKRLTESVLTELRDCLWTCVHRVHVAVEADRQADSETAPQVERLEAAICGLETGAIRTELQDALSSIEASAQRRRDTQRSSFAELAERIDVLSSQLEDARRESETDALTGLGNRKRFEQTVARAQSLASIGRAPISLVLMDLDRLKDINDTLGHAAGDLALQAFAACLSRVFLGESDVLCRIGGDEFVALLPHAHLALAESLSARLAQTVDATVLSSDGRTLSVSVGFAELRAGEDVASWMARADAALYREKAERCGRGATT